MIWFGLTQVDSTRFDLISDGFDLTGSYGIGFEWTGLDFIRFEDAHVNQMLGFRLNETNRNIETKGCINELECNEMTWSELK